MIQIGVLGAQGRMGKLVCSLIQGEFSAKAGLKTQADRGANLDGLLDCDAVVDFSQPEAMLELAELALKRGPRLPAFVVGSTGWKPEQRARLEALAGKTPVLMSSNFSIGVLALLEILRSAAPLLEKLGYTPSIVETHHKHKKDAPSGTAISLQRAISPSGPGNVQTHSVRSGEIIGDHEVTFHGSADHITLGHFAQDRSIFARGAIEAALWLAGKPATGRITSVDSFFKEWRQERFS
jgi:4-hydroxy-tetrahydrodipicolinate reductase